MGTSLSSLISHLGVTLRPMSAAPPLSWDSSNYPYLSSMPVLPASFRDSMGSKCFLDSDFGCKTTCPGAAEISFWVLLTRTGGSDSAPLLLSCLGVCIGAIHLLGSGQTQPSHRLFSWSLLQPLRTAFCRKKLRVCHSSHKLS